MNFYDINKIMMESRIINLSGEINQEKSDEIRIILQALDCMSEEPIKLYINSPGGDVIAGLAIYDAMRMIKAPVYTLCIGRAASMAAWILAAGKKGKRTATENAQVMIHQGRTTMGGTFSDLKISMDEFIRMEQSMIKILAKHTGQTESSIIKAQERDFWMNAEEAKKFGIIDTIVEPVDHE